MFKSSNNASLSRDEIFKITGPYFQSRNQMNKVDYDHPDYVLFIQVICNMCFISFVDNFFKYRKYNLIEMGCKFGEKPVKKDPAPTPTTSSTLTALDSSTTTQTANLEESK